MSAEEQPIPPGVTLVEAAQQAVAGFLAASPIDPLYGELDSIEVVHASTGPAPSDIVPGFELRWHQGDNRFGILTPIERLALQAGGLAGVPFYLHLALHEPHREAPGGTRLWFNDLPSGPYQ